MAPASSSYVPLKSTIESPSNCQTRVPTRKAVQRGIRDLDALSHQQPANLGKTQAVTKPPLDRGALIEAPRPPVTARTPAR